MPLCSNVMAPDVEQASIGGLHQFLGAEDPAIEALSRSAAACTDAQGPSDGGDHDTPHIAPERFVYQVFNLAMDRLADAENLPAATKPVGWRILTQSGGEPIASYVAEAKNGKPAVMTMIQHGSRLSPALKAALAAATLMGEAVLESIQEEFTISAIRAPSLYIEALWAVPKAGGQEWVITFHSISLPVKLNTVIRAEEFLAACKTLAASKRPPK